MGAYKNAGIFYLLLGISMLIAFIAIIGTIGAIMMGSYGGALAGGILFLVSGFLVFIFSLLAGIFSFSVATESDVGTFTAAGVLLILYAILSLVSGFVGGMLFVSWILGMITFIIVGVAFMNLGNQMGAGNIRTAGIITLIGGILLIIGFGVIILMIGLIMGGYALMQQE